MEADKAQKLVNFITYACFIACGLVFVIGFVALSQLAGIVAPFFIK